MTSLYLGSGFRCHVSGACGFRVLPASGDDEDLNEAARHTRMHERSCRFRRIGEPLIVKPRTIDDRRTEQAMGRLRLEEARPHVRSSDSYHREPTGRGWKVVIAEYAEKHPAATANEVAFALNCRPMTAAGYLSLARSARGWSRARRVRR